MFNKKNPFLFKPPYPPPGPPNEMEYQYPAASDCAYRPLPPSYPYINPITNDTYSGQIYHEHNQFPVPGQLPASGPFKGNGFMVKNYYPYLFDTSFVRYGNFISMPENCVTRVSRRPVDSCIDLSGTFDMTTGINKNSVLAEYLEKCVAHKGDQLQGIFPIIKPTLTFKLYYRILDEMGQVVHQAAVSVAVKDLVFHFTDIRDYYVQTAKSIFLTNIPSMDFAGIYRLSLDRLECYGEAINTIDHVHGDLNNHYAFANDNTSILLQPDVIAATPTDEFILLSSVEINQQLPFTANITTRLKLSFTAFLSEMIALPNVYKVWSAMFEPTNITLAALKEEVSGLRDSISLINIQLHEISNALNELRTTVSGHTTTLEDHTNRIAELGAELLNNSTEVDSRLDDLDARVKALENRPLALNRYKAGTEYAPSQLIYNTYGKLYQAAKAFTASGNMNTEIAAGRLVPLTVDGDVFENANAAVVDELVTRVEAVESDMATAKMDIIVNGNNIQINADRITTVAGRVTTNETDIANLKTRVTDTEADITLNKTAIATNVTNIAKNTTDITNIQTTIGTMSDDITTVKSDVESLNTAVASNTSTIGVLSTTVTQHATSIATLESTMETKANQSDVDTLNETLTTVNTKLDTLNGSTITYVTEEEYEALENKVGIYAIKES